MKKTPKDIKNMDERIQKLKNFQRENSEKSKKSSIPDSVANAFRIGTEFVAAVLAGICIGYALDKFFGTKVIFLLVFSLFGCMAGMLNVYRSAKEMDKNIQEGKE
ncbi:MAG: AtpZ/AtpI family protein [Pseudomonadota bacterium]|nr:AtpZ/AtpI family protein [Pseudomonadota bacterium]